MPMAGAKLHGVSYRLHYQGAGCEDECAPLMRRHCNGLDHDSRFNVAVRQPEKIQSKRPAWLTGLSLSGGFLPGLEHQ
jgi:hypothetical protein